MELKKLKKRQLVDLVEEYETTNTELNQEILLLKNEVEENKKQLNKTFIEEDSKRIKYLRNRLRVVYDVYKRDMYERRLNYFLI